MIRVRFKDCYYLFLLLVGVVLCTQQTVEAQTVTVINENNDQVIIPDSILHKAGKSEEDTDRKIASWLNSVGYFRAVKKHDDSGNTVWSTGCRFELGSVLFSTPPAGSYIKPVTTSYSDKTLESVIERELDLYREQGFYFVQATIYDLITDELACTVDASVTVQKGALVYADQLLFSGNRLNSADYLITISGFRDSLLVTDSNLQVIQTALNGSELFNEVSTPLLYEENEAYVLVTGVEERALNSFDGILGYVPDQSGNGQIVGDFDLSLWNVLAQGNGLNLNYERLRPENTRLTIGVRQHWLGSIPMGAEAGFSLFQNDSTYQLRTIDLKGYYQVRPQSRIILGIGNSQTTSGSNSGLLVEPDGKRSFAELGFRISTLTNPDVPRNGLVFEAMLGSARRSLEIDSLNAYTQNYLKGSLRSYFGVGECSVLALRTELFMLKSDRFTDSDLIRFGGANSFRGYSEEQFNASGLWWGDLEYRFLLNRSSYIFGFVAAGTYNRPQLFTEVNKQFSQNDFLQSLGFGISYRTRIGRLTFSYAVATDEGAGNGKIHVGIRTSL